MTGLAPSQLDAGGAPQPARTPRWVPPLGAVAATFTAMCCIGVSAAVSLSTAVGATFLTRDATLKPLLAAALAVTVAASALTWWHRRRPLALVLTAAAAIWVYGAIYVIGGGHAGHMADHMTDHAAHGAGLSGGRLVAVWAGLAVLVGSQAVDLIRARALRRRGAACDMASRP